MNFQKRDRSKLMKPVVHSDFTRDYAQIKTLVGQGKLYIKLLIDEDLCVEDEKNLPMLSYISSCGKSSSNHSENLMLAAVLQLQQRSHICIR